MSSRTQTSYRSSGVDTCTLLSAPSVAAMNTCIVPASFETKATQRPSGGEARLALAEARGQPTRSRARIRRHVRSCAFAPSTAVKRIDRPSGVTSMLYFVNSDVSTAPFGCVETICALLISGSP